LREESKDNGRLLKKTADRAVKLIESLDGGRDTDVDTIWAREVERRCAAVDAVEAVTSDWEEGRSRIEREIFRR
jgi:hypothetical protein